MGPPWDPKTWAALFCARVKFLTQSAPDLLDDVVNESVATLVMLDYLILMKTQIIAPLCTQLIVINIIPARALLACRTNISKAVL